MVAVFDPSRSSWVEYSNDTDFPIQNIPFGISSVANGPRFVSSRIGDYVIDLGALHGLGAFRGMELPEDILRADHLNAFIALGKEVTGAVRSELMDILDIRHAGSTLASKRNAWLIPLRNTVQHLPVQIGDYTDFYSSIEHATNVGKMFRDPENALLPNWRHLPVGYHGRASSIMVSGHTFHRPVGQINPDDNQPLCAPTRLLDFELEMAFIIGQDTRPGERIPTSRAEEYIFGLLLFNDWSARDIQKWEYVPLGPFLGKNFASTVSPWIVTLEALEPFRKEGPVQSPEVLPYLKTDGPGNYDIALEVCIQPRDGAAATVCKSNFKYMYWDMRQQLAHHTINGCNVRVGDLYASGTISGPTEDSFGSMLELSWKGTKAIDLADGLQRRFIQDYDTVILRGAGEHKGIKIGFGECSAQVLPAIPL